MLKWQIFFKISGENDDEPTVNWARYNGNMDKVPMKVPDRILVAGML